MQISEFEQAALSKAAGNAALKRCYDLLKTDQTAIKQAHWARLSLACRRIAVNAANLPAKRADDALSKFTDAEKALINLRINRLAQELAILSKVMRSV